MMEFEILQYQKTSPEKKTGKSSDQFRETEKIKIKAVYQITFKRSEKCNKSF